MGARTNTNAAGFTTNISASIGRDDTTTTATTRATSSFSFKTRRYAGSLNTLGHEHGLGWISGIAWCMGSFPNAVDDWTGAHGHAIGISSHASVGQPHES